jgi:hypothetical protein
VCERRVARRRGARARRSVLVDCREENPGAHVHVFVYMYLCIFDVRRTYLGIDRHAWVGDMHQHV